MNVNGIGTAGYPAWQGARKAQQNTAGKNFANQVNNVASAPKTYQIYSEEDMLWSGGNGTGLSYYNGEDKESDTMELLLFKGGGG